MANDENARVWRGLCYGKVSKDNKRSQNSARNVTCNLRLILRFHIKIDAQNILHNIGKIQRGK